MRTSRSAPTPPPPGTRATTRRETFIEVRALLMQVGKAAWEVAQVGDERQVAQASEMLAEARRALYRILAEEGDA